MDGSMKSSYQLKNQCYSCEFMLPIKFHEPPLLTKRTVRDKITWILQSFVSKQCICGNNNC